MTQYGGQRINSEFIPLTEISEDEHDITDEILPPPYDAPYHNPQSITQTGAEEIMPLGGIPMETKRKRVRKVVRNSWCLGLVGCGCLFIPGFAFLIFGIVSCQSL